MTRTVEGGGGGGGRVWTCLFSFTLCPLSPSQYIHTHTHTHTHFSFFFLVIIRAHTYTVTIVFSPFLRGGGGDFTIICFIYSFFYQFTCLFICSFVHLFVYLLIYSFVCLFTWKMSFLPPGILHRFICLHNYVKKKAFFLFFYYSWLFLVAHLLSMISEEITAFITSYTVHEQCNCKPI